MNVAAYLGIGIMLVLSVLFASLSRLMASRLHPKDPTPEKLGPYECGIVPEEGTVPRFPVQFYLVAVMFIAFDIEIIFLFPWAVKMRQLGMFGVIEMLVFVGIVFIAYGYIRREGVLEWAPSRKLSKEGLMEQFRKDSLAAQVGAGRVSEAEAAAAQGHLDERAATPSQATPDEPGPAGGEGV